MSIYHTVDDHLDDYIESLGGNRSTLDDAVRWVARELYHHDENIRLLGAITMHTLALDRDALAQGQGGRMNTEQERAEFEAWYLENNDVPHEAIKRKGAGYAWIGTDEAWEIWQAAQAALKSQDAERLQAAARDMFVRASEIEVLYGTNKETEGLVMAAIRLAYLVGTTEQNIDRARRVEGDSNADS